MNLFVYNGEISNFEACFVSFPAVESRSFLYWSSCKSQNPNHGDFKGFLPSVSVSQWFKDFEAV